MNYVERLGKVAQFIHTGEFRSFAEWVNKAQSWIGGAGAICVDAQGRECAIGRDFRRAHDEGAFPVTYVYVAGARTRELPREPQGETDAEVEQEEASDE